MRHDTAPHQEHSSAIGSSQSISRGGTIMQRYGAAALARGYTAVPNLLLARYRALGLGDGELIFVIELLSYWPGDRLPCPALGTVAARMGKSVRQVQSYVERLRSRGLVAVIARRDEAGRQVANAYDLSPLLGALGARQEDAVELGPAPRRISGLGVRPTSPLEDSDQNSIDLDSIAPYPQPCQDAAAITPPTTVDVLQASVLAIGRELGDQAPSSSVVRVARLIDRAGLEAEEGRRLLAEARARTLERQAASREVGADVVRRAMAYCLRTFEALLQPRPPAGAVPAASTREPRAAQAGGGPTAETTEVSRDPVEGPDPSLWARVREELRLTLPPPLFATRVLPLCVREVSPASLVIEASSEFERLWLTRVLSRRIDAALSGLGRAEVQVQICARAA